MSLPLLRNATAPQGSDAPMPRSVLVFAHPDDEVVAVGARIGRFQSALFVHVTDGAPLNGEDSRAHGFLSVDDYREARERELDLALAMAGLQGVRRERLMIPDQQASVQLSMLTRTLHRRISEHDAEVVFTHPYEGGHPDHDACAFAVHHAVACLRAEGRPAPAIIEAAFYHAGPGGIEAAQFLPPPDNTEQVEYRLSPEELARKEALIACFRTQQQTLHQFPLQYERFRIAPTYDFLRPPHPGQLLYDRFPWGMTSKRFCELAGQEAKETCH